jgi:hypothetical protein
VDASGTETWGDVITVAEAAPPPKQHNQTHTSARAGLERWRRWAERRGPALVDPGRPLGNALGVTRDGVTASDTGVVGMSILQAASRDEASSLVAGHHHPAWSDGCEIVLLEEMPIPELH